MRGRALIAVAMAACTVAAPAGAATITAPKYYSEGDDETLRTLRYAGNGGERNTVRVSKAGPGTLLFTDSSASKIEVRDTPDCRKQSLRSVICRPDGDVSDMAFWLGPGNDRLQVSTRRTRGFILSIFVSGGSGDDTVRSRFEARIDGESGDDRISVRTGDEELETITGGSGDDLLAGGWRLDGGLGDDTLRRAQFLEGGPGNDNLFAVAEGSFFRGGPGHDLLVGGEGASTLGPLPGSPSEYGAGPGNDRLDTVNGTGRDSPIDCGKGRDRIRADPRDRLWRCEIVERVRRGQDGRSAAYLGSGSSLMDQPSLLQSEHGTYRP